MGPGSKVISFLRTHKQNKMECGIYQNSGCRHKPEIKDFVDITALKSMYVALPG